MEVVSLHSTPMANDDVDDEDDDSYAYNAFLY